MLRWRFSRRWLSMRPGAARGKRGRKSIQAWPSVGDAGGWGLVFYSALGLGFLTKGPVILLLVAVTVIPLPGVRTATLVGPAPACLRLGNADLRRARVELAGRRTHAKIPPPRGSGCWK